MYRNVLLSKRAFKTHRSCFIKSCFINSRKPWVSHRDLSGPRVFVKQTVMST